MVKLSDFLEINLLEPDIQASNMADCLRMIVILLARYQAIQDPTEVLEKLLEREKVMSTGIGAGIAIPHARCASLNKTIVCIALSKDGIDFNSLDGDPVKMVFLLLGPQDSSTLHVRLLAQIAKMIKDREFIERLRNASTPEEMMKLVKGQELKELKEDGVE